MDEFVKVVQCFGYYSLRSQFLLAIYSLIYVKVIAVCR